MKRIRRFTNELIYYKVKRNTMLFILTAILLITFQSCCHSKIEKKKIVYINSYHHGHPSSDEIMDGIIESFKADSFELNSYFMDTKRNPSQEYIENIASQLFDSILAINPDIMIVSDDNAVKYIVEPYFHDKSLPIVFCGVNWTEKEYSLPANIITGMLEILPLADLLFTLRPYYPSMEKLLVLNENTTTSRKEKQILDTLFNRAGVTASYELVDDFGQWKSAFKEANQSYDIIYISTNGAINGWDHEEAVKFINQNINVPVVTCEDFMMPYSVFGFTKVAKEQGIWAASVAKKILQGSSPGDFPLTRNQLSTIWINATLANKIGFKADSALLSKAKIIEN